MRRVILSTITVFMINLFTGTAYGMPVKPKKGTPGCQNNLVVCEDDLDTCDDDLMTCEDNAQVFPGDGFSDPSFGTNGHGPALSYTDNGNGTFTDDNTRCMWEKKDSAGGVHDKDNLYSWSIDDGDLTDPDGTMFSDFLHKMNNKCDGDETTSCTTDANCFGIGNGLCGHAGYRDWLIPNIKQLQSIADYSAIPAISVPGTVIGGAHWSSTTPPFAGFELAFQVNFGAGSVEFEDKDNAFRVRAVRGCPNL